MWSKLGIESIASTIRNPLEAEYKWTKWGHDVRLCVMMDYIQYLPTMILVICNKNGRERIEVVDVRYRFNPLGVKTAGVSDTTHVSVGKE